MRLFKNTNMIFTSGPAGIEPTTSDSESDIIPLNYSPIYITLLMDLLLEQAILQKKTL